LIRTGLSELKISRLPTVYGTQKGVSFFGALIFLIAAVFALIFAAQMVPAYVESFSVGKTLQSLLSESKDNVATEEKIRTLLMRRFNVNDVKNVKAQDITVKFSPGKIIVRVNYEVRGSLVANTDIVTRFDKSVEIAR